MSALVLAAHGTRSAAGRAEVERLRAGVARRWPGQVQVGFVDVCPPSLIEVLAAAGPAPVVVPLFLSAGLHATDDVTHAIGEAGAERASVTAPLACAAGLVDCVVRPLLPVPLGADGVVLAAAGSSRSEARQDAARLAELASERLGVPVVEAFVAGSGRSLPEAVQSLAGEGPSRVAVLGLLLARGHFATRLEQACREHGLAPPTPPLLSRDGEGIADLVVDLARRAPGSC